jgi:large subunit ribosomal protein L18
MFGKKKLNPREHRKERERFRIKGTADRPRMNVFRSAKHIYVQIIDDDAGATLVAASSLDKELRGHDGNKTATAEKVGKLAVQRALDKGIHKLVFDRAGFRYTGRVAAVSKAAHEAGLLTRGGAGSVGPSAETNGEGSAE